jgi:flagellar basal-body rod modification protein FlgD
MTINAVSNDTQYTRPMATGNNKTLGKDEFLNLLVTQLQHQDPLNPMDSTAFTSQLAEFSALEQLHNVNTNLGTLQTTQAGIENAQAVNYIGKQIMASGDSIRLSGGEADAIHFTLGSDAAAIYINVYDAAGQYIKGFENGALPSGNHAVQWDGTDSNGNLMSDGTYGFEVLAVDRANQMIPVGTYTTGQVRGVNFQNGEAYLVTDAQEIPLSSVLQIMETQQP